MKRRHLEDAFGRRIRVGDMFAYAAPQFVPTPSGGPVSEVFADGKLRVVVLVKAPTDRFETLDEFTVGVVVGDHPGEVVRMVSPRGQKNPCHRVLVRRASFWSRVRRALVGEDTIEEQPLTSDAQERELNAAELLAAHVSTQRKRWL